MDQLRGIKTPNLKQGTALEIRERIRDYFHKSFTTDVKLYEILSDSGAFYLRPDPLRHPLIFYFGHTAVFYINKLNIAGIVRERLNAKYESMFAVGVDEMSWDDLNEAHYDWPRVEEVQAYRDRVRAYVNNLIDTLPLPEGGVDWGSPWWAIIMGAEHQRIHLETSSVLIRQLPLDKVRDLPHWNICEEDPPVPNNELIPVSGGKITLGKDFSDPYYGWDNEYGKKEFEITGYRAAKYLVSNREYLAFVESGGYLAQRYWTEEGWAWNSFQKAGMPRFWQKHQDGSYSLRLIAKEIAMPWSHPVEVNYLEAKAFCNWKTELEGNLYRLPTEAEWYHLRDTNMNTDQPLWDKAPGNINLEYFASACPVNRFRFGDFYDIVGNVWQWTETPISGFPGFKIHPYYDDFSVPTFDGRHNLIKGGSFISTGNEALRASRYAFRRHFYQHAGFRYIESEAEVVIEDNLYEDDPEIVTFCDLDWDSCFARELMDKILDTLPDLKTQKVLQIGCKTGRLAMEAAKYGQSVVGIDATARIIQLATSMKEQGLIRYSRQDEGEIIQTVERNLAEFGLEEIAEKVEFWQADSSNLAAKFCGYDLILGVNALEEARDPIAFIREIPNRLLPGGYLILADSYHFSGAERPAGIRKDGEPYRGLDWLQEELSHSFDPVGESKELWQKLRRDSRNMQCRRLQISFWKKRT